MHDFGPFCYLDTQKTGSTFVSSFLNAHISLPAIKFKKHGPYRSKAREPGKFFFISARDPLAWYRSLYSFGCERKGRLYRTMRFRGLGRLYRGTSDGFAEWAEFLLDPRSASSLPEGYRKVSAELFGFQTFRFLACAFPDPIRRLRKIRDADELMEAWRHEALPKRIIRTETLNADLTDLARHELHGYIDDHHAAFASLAAMAPMNRSSDFRLEISPVLLRRLQEREWFMFDVVGYPRYL